MAMIELIKRLLRSHPNLFRIAAAGYRSFKMLPQTLRAGSGAMNWILAHMSAALRLDRAWGGPMTLNIEPTTVCDQKCTICEKGLGILGRKPRHMRLEEFASILSRFDRSLQNIFFYFMGESFLNKEAYRMIRLAADRGIHVHACTNGNRIDAEALVRSGIADIQFQIGGTTQETHVSYRVGGHLDKVLENIRQTIEWRNRLSADLAKNPYPMNVTLGFILMRHNEHQAGEVAALAKSLGVDRYEIIAPCVRTVKQGHDLLPVDKAFWLYDPEAFALGRLEMRRKPNNFCEWLYASMTIQVDGNVVPCCRDPLGHMVLGNVHKESPYQIWNNDKYRALRRQVRTRQGSLDLCRLCEGFGMLDLRGPRPTWKQTSARDSGATVE